MIGNASTVKELTQWLKTWHQKNTDVKKKTACLKRPAHKGWSKIGVVYGPTGVGKTLAVRLVGQALGYTLVECTPDDLKDKKQFDVFISNQRTHTVQDTGPTSAIRGQRPNTPIHRHRVIVVDEGDLPKGSRGGAGLPPAWMTVVKEMNMPWIFIVQDKYTLAAPSLTERQEFPFYTPFTHEVAMYIQKALQPSGWTVDRKALEKLIDHLNGDIRQVWIQLELFFRTETTFYTSDAERVNERIPEVPAPRMGLWDQGKKMFAGNNAKMTVEQKLQLCLEADTSLLANWMHQNYLKMLTTGDTREAMERTADCFSMADALAEAPGINPLWTTAPYYATLTCLLPGWHCQGDTRMKQFEMIGKNRMESKRPTVLKDKEATLHSLGYGASRFKKKT